MRTTFDQDQIVQLYSEGLSMSQVAKKIPCSKRTVERVLLSKGIQRRSKSSWRKHTFNYNFFDIIDSECKAYFLGLLFADGYCDKDSGRVMIGLQEQDGYILEKFKEVIQFTGNLTFISKAHLNQLNQYHICLTSKYLSSVLDNHGMVRAKSLILKFPTTIPNSLLNHFIRGFFDGNGCATTKNGYTVISIISTLDVLRNIKSTINTYYGIDKGSISERSKTNSPVKQLEFYGSNITTLVRDYMYKNANFFLTRKYDKLRDIKIKRKQTMNQVQNITE